MSKHKVECKCCGMMMVPKTIFSRGVYGGWGWRIGGGKPVSSCCPFCLSEAWDGSIQTLQTTTGYRLLALFLSFVVLIGGIWLLVFINTKYLAGGLPGFFVLMPIGLAITFAWYFTRVR